jgi:flagellar biosynthesis anti-sigma factor FlgM
MSKRKGVCRVMRIDSRNAQLIKMYVNEKHKIDSEKNIAKGRENSKTQSDVVEISRESKDFLLVSKGIETAEKIREHRLSEIKTLIENGTYEVSSKEVAEAILSRINRQDRIREE